MKLASLNHGRDGELVVVNSTLTQALKATGIAPTLQAALDNWSSTKPKLEALAKDLEAGRTKEAFAFDPKKLHSPLPRAYQWVDGSAYLHHVELVRKARGAVMPPRISHRSSDVPGLLGFFPRAYREHQARQ